MAGPIDLIVTPIAIFLELVAAVVVLGGALSALLTLVRDRNAMGARGRFSHSLLLGLDFTVGADMLKLAAAPDISSALLGVIVAAVRIALTFTLLREEGPAGMARARVDPHGVAP